MPFCSLWPFSLIPNCPQKQDSALSVPLRGGFLPAGPAESLHGHVEAAPLYAWALEWPNACSCSEGLSLLENKDWMVALDGALVGRGRTKFG